MSHEVHLKTCTLQAIRIQMAGAYYATAQWMVTFHTGGVRAACISSLPKSACSTANNIPFPLFYSHGMWPMNSFEIKFWQAKQKSYACDSVKNETLELPFSFYCFLR